MAKRGGIYKCDICGNVVYVLEEGGGDLVCCGEDMRVLAGDEAAAFSERTVTPLRILEYAYRIGRER